MPPSTPVPSQAELLFEVAGLFAAGQFLFKMMFADEREKALTEIKCVGCLLGAGVSAASRY